MNRTTDLPAILRARPGSVLQEEFLDGHGLTQAALAERTGIPRATVNEIIKGKRPIKADTALALSIFFGTSAEFWLNLQSGYDARRVRYEREAEMRARIKPLATA